MQELERHGEREETRWQVWLDKFTEGLNSRVSNDELECKLRSTIAQAISNMEMSLLDPGGSIDTRLFNLKTELQLKMQHAEAKVDKVDDWAGR